MNSFSPKKQLSHLEKNNINVVRSNKREISIIQEVKENYTKSKISKSPKENKYESPTYSNKLYKNKSTIFGNNKTKLIPLDNKQKNKFKNILYNSELEKERNRNRGKEFYNKLSLERINFQFEEYGEYPNDDFQPSIYFFKFLANKPDYEKENQEKGKACISKLKLFIPDKFTFPSNSLNIAFIICNLDVFTLLKFKLFIFALINICSISVTLLKSNPVKSRLFASDSPNIYTIDSTLEVFK